MDPFRISLAKPPPSPTERISYNPQKFSAGPDIFSPKRKQWGSTGPPTKRKVAKIALKTTAGSSKSLVAQTKARSADTGQGIGTNREPAPVENDFFPADSPTSIYQELSNEMAIFGYNKIGRTKDEIQTIQSEDTAYGAFVDAVFASECDFWQISRNIFIVNGWNQEAKTATNTFYHLQMVIVGVERRCHCLCPAGKQVDECFHIRFIKDHGEDKFPADHRMTGRIL